jgi:hypothetical protein
MLRRFLMATALGLLAAGLSGRAEAGITIYLDRAAFLAAIRPGPFLEDFQGLPEGALASPQAFSGSGFGFQASAPSGLFVNDYGGDKVLAVANDTESVTIASLSGPTPVTALGGYFFVDFGELGPINPDASMSVRASDGSDTATQALAAPTTPTTFVGFVSDGPALTSLSFVWTGGLHAGFVATNDFIVGAVAPTAVVPEPSTLALATPGGLGLLGYARRRRRA